LLLIFPTRLSSHLLLTVYRRHLEHTI
jgi:hypothetical protein